MTEVTPQLPPLRLVADAGGTNTRLALSRAGKLVADSADSFANAEWHSLEDLIASYLAAHGSAEVDQMVIAVAGPVEGTRATLTNRNWQVETEALERHFGCEKVYLLNDLTALGYAVPALRGDQLREICSGNDAPRAPLRQALVAGIGTGFNVSPVLAAPGGIFCPAAEAGHAALPLSIAEALAQDGLSPAQFETVETLFSGRGFSLFCQQLTGDTGLGGSDAIAAYGAGGPVAAAVDRYATLLGLLLRELSLYYMCTSGIYLAGSVARAVLRTAPGPCIAVLKKPARIGKTAETPVWTIEDDRAALLGCAGFS